MALVMLTTEQGGQIFFVKNRPKMVKIRTFCRTRSPIWAKNRTLLWGVCTSEQLWYGQNGSKKVWSLHADSNSTSKDTINFKGGGNSPLFFNQMFANFSERWLGRFFGYKRGVPPPPPHVANYAWFVLSES